ncbi:hypothetical protein [Pantoea vagans]|uniref:hypothetical protein n=1 Tax=Pantoea vagans TaxID=470934 RepID=UPI0028B06192|nr:hypothetical protein [Pantoea vagans]
MKSIRLNKVVSVNLILLIALTLFYYSVSSYLLINSDSASSLLMAKDGAEGNFLLRGWYLSTQAYYFTDTLWLTILFKLFGFHKELAFIYVGLMYSLMVMISFKLLGRKTILGAAILTGVIVLPTIYQAYSSLVVNIHIATYTCALASIYLVIHFSINERLRYLITCLCISIPVIYSDSMYLYVLVIPVLAASCVAVFFGLLGKAKAAWFVVLCIAIVIGGKLFGYAVSEVFHFHLPAPEAISNPKFQREDKMLSNIYLAFNGLSDYFGAKFYGHDIKSFMGATRFFNFFVMLSFAAMLAYCSYKSHKKDFASILLSASAVIMFLAYIFSDLATDQASPRYFFFSLVTGSILVGRTLIVSKRARNIIVASFLLCGVTKAMPLVELKKDMEVNQYKSLNDFLKSSGLKRGYSSFWYASSLTIFGDLNIVPVAFWEGAHNMKWLSKDDWYKEKRNFIIYDNESDRKYGLSQFGKPDHELIFGDKFISVYRDGISLENGPPSR